MPIRCRTDRLLVASAGVGWVLAAPCASAQTAPVSLADQRYARGAELYRTQDYAGALEEFRASLALRASPNTRLMLARCFRNLGRLAQAMPEFERTVREADDLARTNPRYEQTATVARQERDLIAGQFGRIEIRVRGVALADVEVRLDGEVVPTPPSGESLLVFPGSVELVVASAGFETQRRRVRVDSQHPLSLAFEFVHPALAVAGAPATRVSHRHHLADPAAVVGGISLALGAASWVTCGIAWSNTNATFTRVENCSPGCSNHDTLLSSGHTWQDTTNVMFGLGVGFTALGIAGLIAGVSLPMEQVQISVSPHSAAVRIRF